MAASFATAAAVLMLGTAAVATPAQAATEGPGRTLAAPMAPVDPCPAGPAGQYCDSGDKAKDGGDKKGDADACKMLSDKARELCEKRSKKDDSDPCDLIKDTPAGQYCQSDNEKGSAPTKPGGLTDSGGPLDPLQSIADGCATAGSWIITRLSYAVSATSTVDFTNSAFLAQYAIVFAASTILTLILWLVAVMKRALRGVPLTTAIGEAVGFLWLTVMASAFTPLILYTIVGAVDAVTAVIADKGASDQFFGGFAKALKDSSGVGGGPIMKIVVSIVSIAAAGILWLEMVIRTAVLYVGAVLGTVVYSGLVDKQLWTRVRTWAGIMGAVIGLKPVVAIVLLLASALSHTQGNQPLGAVISGLAIIILAIIASAVIYRFIPGLGDDIAASRRAIMVQASGRNRMPQSTSPARSIQQGISTHSERGIGPQSTAPRPSTATGHASGGLAAHSSRPSRPADTRGSAGSPDSRQRADQSDRTGR